MTGTITQSGTQSFAASGFPLSDPLTTVGDALHLTPLEQGEALRLLDQIAADDCGAKKYDRFGYVEVKFVKGDATTEAAAKQLAQHLTDIDKRITALPDDLRIPVTARNGDVIGHLTGAKVKQAWNSQSWVMHPKGTLFPNGRPAATGPGLTKFAPGVAEEYLDFKKNMTFDVYFGSIIAHEMGHVWGREIGRSEYEEAMANETAAAVMKAIGMPFRYDSNSGKEMLWNPPNTLYPK